MLGIFCWIYVEFLCELWFLWVLKNRWSIGAKEIFETYFFYPFLKKLPLEKPRNSNFEEKLNSNYVMIFLFKLLIYLRLPLRLKSQLIQKETWLMICEEIFNLFVTCIHGRSLGSVSIKLIIYCLILVVLTSLFLFSAVVWNLFYQQPKF